MYEKAKKWCFFGGLIALISICLGFFVYGKLNKTPNSYSKLWETSDKYKLEKVVVFSRHNIRSPLSGGDSSLSTLTNHEWYKWSSAYRDLSLRGGISETLMGQYLRKYLSSKGLMDENWNPSKNQIRCYANSLQRTIATSNYFMSGFLPVANINVETHNKYGEMDKVFEPRLTSLDSSFSDKALKEILEMFNKKSLNEILESLSENFKVLEKVLDFKDSKYAKENNLTEFKKNDLEVKFEENKEPSLKGSLKLACSAADALTLQYYEEQNDKKAAFGKNISFEDWKKIAEIVDVYQKILFAAPIVAKNIANPLLKELKNELILKDRIFSYLCGHDSNIVTILAALDTESYSLQDSITQTVPIGSKFMIEKWSGPDGKEYAKLFLVYSSVSQIRDFGIMDLDNPPCRLELSLKDMSKNEDGFYLLEDIIKRFDKSINAYNKSEKLKVAA